MTDHDERVVPASLAIPASADIVFAALADPSRHPLWDGNDNLKFSSTGQRVQRVGDIFSTTLTGGSVRENHVVEFVESQVIAWMPAEPGQMPVGHVWRFTLAPIDPKVAMATMLSMTLATVAMPAVAEAATSGSGKLSGVASLTSNGGGYCALLTSGGVDCWGYGYHGELGNGQFYTSGNYGSAIPVTVVSTSGSGTLSGVASLTSNGGGYCALLTSGRVDCWGTGYFGQLGNGKNDASGNYGSAKPVAVVSTSGSGTLSGVASLTSNGGGYCALLTSGRVGCWGYGNDGELGNGKFYTSGNRGSAKPVAVVSTSGSGTLSGVKLH